MACRGRSNHHSDGPKLQPRTNERGSPHEGLRTTGKRSRVSYLTEKQGVPARRQGKRGTEGQLLGSPRGKTIIQSCRGEVRPPDPYPKPSETGIVDFTEVEVE